MRRTILLLGALTLTTLAAPNISTATAASCTTSFPADGHPGPWHTTTNGGTLHGNTAHIQCPSPTTHWDVDYTVQIHLSDGTWWSELLVHRQGNGTPNDFSATTNPYPCDDYNYRTHVINNVTGGLANKPTPGTYTRIC